MQGMIRMFALAQACVVGVTAHRPILGRNSEGAEFSTMDTALDVPWIATSWAVNRIATCDAPVFWMKADVLSSNFPLYLGAGVPRLDRFKDTGVAMLLVGPGVATSSDLADHVPAEVTSSYTLPDGHGAMVFTPPAPAEQTDCSYLVDSPLKESEDTHAVLGRCNFYERWGGSNSWPQADGTVTVGPGTYYVGFWAFEGSSASISTGKFWATMSDITMAENFGPILAHSCEAAEVAACASANIADTNRTAAQIACEDAGACTFTEAGTGYMGPTPASCTTTPIQACTDADLSVDPQAACEAAGACQYNAGPATTWGVQTYGMGPTGEFPVPANQGATFYEQGAHAGMANMAPPAVACGTCPFGTGHSGTPSTSCPSGCDTSSGCATIACSQATTNATVCEAAGEAAGVDGASCVFTPANPTPPFGPPVPVSCAPTPDDCNEVRSYAGEVTCDGVDGAVAGGTSELWVDVGTCVCGAIARGARCSFSVSQVADLPAAQDLVQPCVQSLLADYGTDELRQHCPAQCPGDGSGGGGGGGGDGGGAGGTTNSTDTDTTDVGSDDAPKGSGATQIAPLAAAAAMVAIAGW